VYAVFGSKGGIVGTLLTRFKEEADAGEWQERIRSARDATTRLAAFAGRTMTMCSTSRILDPADSGCRPNPALAELQALGTNAVAMHYATWPPPWRTSCVTA